MTPGPAKTCAGLSHSTISEKSSPCLGEGAILTHMAPDPARWQIRAEGVLLFGASERPSNHPGVDLDDPRCPKPKPGALRDGQKLTFYVRWWNLTVAMCTTLSFWTPRIGHIDPRMVQEPFRCSKNHATSYTDLQFGKIGHHMGQNDALAIAWGALFRNGAGAYTKCTIGINLAAHKPQHIGLSS